MQKIAIIVPHGDDEVLGFGGTISKYVKKGDKVDVVFTKKAFDLRSSSQMEHSLEAASFLGYTPHFLNIKPENLLGTNIKTLNFLENIIAELSPNLLYIPHKKDAHQDHNSLFKLIKIVTRINGPAPVPKILSGEIISSTGMSFNNVFKPNYYNIISSSDVANKQKALEFYKTEIKNYPHSRSLKSIQIYAAKRGLEAGSEYAEAFKCLRDINM